MRIICDHCSQPISGTVKKLAGNFNLHPDCLAQLGKGSKRESAADSWQSQESSSGRYWSGEESHRAFHER